MRKIPPLALGHLAALSVALLSLSVSAAQPQLVKNIYEGASKQGLYPEWKVAAGQQVFMLATDEAHGRELWVSDGTEAGTHIVKDITPGPGSSDIQQIVASGDRVFLKVYDPSAMGEAKLWVSDGTEAGTRLEVDFSGRPSGQGIAGLSPFKNGVMFVADSVAAPTALWFTEGKGKDPTLVMTLDPTQYPESAYVANPVSWREHNGLFYFFLHEAGGVGATLWVTNGSPSGTRKLKHFPNASEEPFGLWIVGAAGKKLYFTTSDDNGWRYLWTTEGTAASTTMLKQVAVYTDDPSVVNPFLTVNGRAYFIAQDPDVGGMSLWTSDGTVAGTRMLEDYSSNPELAITGMVSRQGKLDITYTIYEGHAGRAGLWCYDPATNQKKELYEAEGYMVDIGSTDSQTLFIQQFGAGGFALGKTDGTPEGTVLIRNYEGWYSASPELQMEGVGSVVLFNVESQLGSWLWRTDGTAEGTRELVSLRQAPGGSSPSHLRTLGGHIYFAAKDPVHGEELWRTDGTTAGTVRVADVFPGIGSSEPRDMVELDGQVYFTANDGTLGRELWVTDGSAEGTHLVKDLIEGSYSSEPQELTVFNNRLYFRAKLSSTHGWEVWRSDGTGEGTEVYATLSPNAGVYYASLPRKFVVVDGWLYFIAQSQATAGLAALFRTDGSSGVSQVGVVTGVTDLVVRPPVSGAVLNPNESMLYLTAPGTGSSNLYRCTVGGTPSLILSRADVRVESLVVAGQYVLWFQPGQEGLITISNGTSFGTYQVGGSSSIYCGTAGGRIYYANRSSDFRQPTELRSAQFSLSGSELVMEVPYTCFFTPVYSVDDTLLFKATVDGGSSRLMRTAGSSVNTVEIQGIGEMPAEGSWNTGPTTANFQELGDHLYFGASGPEGVELYRLPLAADIEISVQQDWGKPRVLAPGEALDFGAEGLGVTRQATLLFRNVGLKRPEGIDFYAPVENPEDFAFNPGGSGEGYDNVSQVTFTPTATGLREGTLICTINGIDRDIPLVGKGLSGKAAPAISGPSGRGQGYYLVGEGVRLKLPTPPLGTPGGLAASVWFKDGKQVSDQPSITIPAVKLKDGGTYTYYAVNRHGYAQAKPAYVVVLGEMLDAVSARDKVTLTCPVRGPTGLLSYQWRRDGVRLVDQGRIQGCNRPRLTLNDLRPEDAGDYECVVTMATPDGPLSESNGSTTLVVEERPSITPPEEGLGLTNYVGEEVEYALELSSEGRISIQGLPPGLRMDATGLITGRPSRAQAIDPVTGLPKAYQVTVTLRDAETKLTSPPMTFPWTILPAPYAGTYQGNVERGYTEEPSALQMGGTIKFTVTNNRSLSGQLRYSGKTYAFKGRPNPEEDPEMVITELKRPGKQPLYLVFAYDADFGYYNVSIQDLEVDFSTETIARPRAFTTLNPALDYQGNHHIVIEPNTSGNAATCPQGMSFFTLRVGSTGEAVWAGRMADDTPIAGSSLMVKHRDDYLPRLEIHSEIYKQGGSVHGFLEGNLRRGNPLIDWTGVMSWNKSPVPNPARTRLYPEGFFAEGLSVTGSKYLPPVAGQLVLDLSGDTPDNVTFAAYDPHVLGLQEQQFFTLGENHQVTLPEFSVDNTVRSLSIDPVKGTFTGTVEITDENPEDTAHPWVRTGKFQGVLLPTYQVGQAYCILPELPDEEGETLNSTPLKSFAIGIWKPVP